MCVTLEMTYFRDELVRLIVSRSDSELEVQRYGIKKNTLTVDPIMLQDELWMRQREKPSANRQSRFFGNWTTETFEFWGRFGSFRFLENRYPKFLSDSAPLMQMPETVSAERRITLIITQWVPGSRASNNKCPMPIRAEAVAVYQVWYRGALWWKQLCTIDRSLNLTHSGALSLWVSYSNVHHSH